MAVLNPPVEGTNATDRNEQIRQLLAAAAALGIDLNKPPASPEVSEIEFEPELDRRGRLPSPITRRGYAKGREPATKGKRREPEPLHPEEVIAIIRQISRHGHGGARDRALVVLLWRCGLRISEALDLRVRDLDLDNLFLRVQHGKGDKYRMVALDRMTEREIRSWLARRAKIPGIEGGDYVFCTISQPSPGLRMGAPVFRSKLKLLARRAGVQRDVYPHQLRHTCARDLINEGFSILVVKEQLGHEHVSTTEHYVGRLMPDVWLRQILGRPDVEFLDLPANEIRDPTAADYGLAIDMIRRGIEATAGDSTTPPDRLESLALVIEQLRYMKVLSEPGYPGFAERFAS